MMAKILTAKDVAFRDGLRTQREWIEKRCKRLGRAIDTPFTSQVSGEPVKARIDYGRWIADCPECDGAEYVDPDERIFYCFSCGNLAQKGDARPVEFPEEREAIEQAILERPVLEQRGSNAITRAALAKEMVAGLVRSWSPGETPDDLRRQATIARLMDKR